jgi:chromosome segregation ATPase
MNQIANLESKITRQKSELRYNKKKMNRYKKLLQNQESNIAEHKETIKDMERQILELTDFVERTYDLAPEVANRIMGERNVG